MVVMKVVSTTSEFPVSLNHNSDIKAHDDLIASKKHSLTNPGGTVCRFVDFAPGILGDKHLHRVQVLEYTVVIEGENMLGLDSGASQLLQKGDTDIQRATMHGWTNPSKTD